MIHSRRLTHSLSLHIFLFSFLIVLSEIYNGIREDHVTDCMSPVKDRFYSNHVFIDIVLGPSILGK